eukprot:TRINITY_DN12670_c0_g1_i1.p2 TRINITY_DN12670_c0_g1~~TRINITY_DN12670_c0_g1_i1.p2  ORF type:complete len:206 (-),score=68.10 TRINITY_DN12670_c0_g1_i1:840-1457(-)
MINRREKGTRPKEPEAIVQTVVDSTYGRRHWEVVQAPADREEEQKDEEQEVHIVKGYLKPRTEKFNFNARIGTETVVTKNPELDEKLGFFCKTCNVLTKNSQAYVEHVNGRDHASRLGMTTKVERSTVEAVREKLNSLKKKPPMQKPEELEAKEEAKPSAKPEAKEEAKSRKKAKKEKEETSESEDEVPDEIRSMGLPTSFGKKR